jgi:hypothetical protein
VELEALESSLQALLQHISDPGAAES